MRALLVTFVWASLTVPIIGSDPPFEHDANPARVRWTPRRPPEASPREDLVAGQTGDRSANDKTIVQNSREFEPRVGEPDRDTDDVSNAFAEPSPVPANGIDVARRVSYEEEETTEPTPKKIPIVGYGESLGEPVLLDGGQTDLRTYGNQCGSCGETYQDRPGCPCGTPANLWVRGEWLLWWTNGMDIPPLVTSSPAGTPGTDAGVLGVDGTTILFGNSTILDDPRSGGRIRIGGRLDECGLLGLEGDFFGLAGESIHYRAMSDGDGNPILARPFFNMNPRDPTSNAFDPPAREDAELVAFPGLVAGAIDVDAVTRLHSAGARLRINLCCDYQSQQDPCSAAPTYIKSSRVDLLLGYRYMRLKERLAISEDLTSLDVNSPGIYYMSDRFDTRNLFHGLEVGAVWERRRNRWSCEVLGKLALGNNHQTVSINGDTVITPFAGGPRMPYSGGLLAQRTNIGRHSRDEFSVIPEIGVTLGFQLTQRLRFTAGYTLIYWGGVVRPGEQIDLDVNPDLLPPEMVPFEGPLRPRFAFHETDFLAHGLGLGLEFVW